MRDIFRDPSLQRRFECEGFVVARVLTANDIKRLIDLHDGASGALMQTHAWFFTALSVDPSYRQAMSHGIREVLQPRIDTVLDRCRALIGNFFHKQPYREESRIHMHQDWSWVDESVHHSLSVWCPLQRVDEANGSLAVVPGSQRLGSRVRGYVTRFPFADIEPLLATKYSRLLLLEPGEVVLFHQALMHCSGPNRSDQRRLAASCFIAPEEAAVRFPHPDPCLHPDRLELLEADEEMLVTFELGKRPAGATSLGLVDASVEAVDHRELERILGPFKPAAN